MSFEEVYDSIEIKDIPLDKISSSPYQPRRYFNDEKIKELADSIQQEGLIQPITVRLLGVNSYELIAGERRLRAHRLIGRKTISAVVKRITAEEASIMTLIENIQRQDSGKEHHDPLPDQQRGCQRLSHQLPRRAAAVDVVPQAEG